MLKYLEEHNAFWFCIPLSPKWPLSMVVHEMWDVQMGEIFTSLVSLKFLNVLASATKFHYQKKKKKQLWSSWFKEIRCFFFRIDENQVLHTTNNLWNERTINFYLPLLALFCCQWLHHLPQMHWKKLEYFIKLF